jgi:hypothetical protein
LGAEERCGGEDISEVRLEEECGCGDGLVEVEAGVLRFANLASVARLRIRRWFEGLELCTRDLFFLVQRNSLVSESFWSLDPFQGFKV